MAFREFLFRVPWPLYPAVLAWVVALIIQILLTRHVDHQKVAQMKITTFGHYLTGKPGTAVLTERGLRLHRWFIACEVVFAVSLVLAALLYSKQ